MIRSIPAARLALSTGLSCLICFAPAWALDANRADVRDFVSDLSQRHGFEADYLARMLTDSISQQKILDAISRPAEKTKPWFEYRAIFMTPERIAAGAAFRAEHAEELARVSAATGVPSEIIAAIVGVETYFGRITGRYRVLDSLATLAFDYPPRGRFFRSELEQFFLLARDEQLDVAGVNGSYAGAMGPPQFMPSSYRAYAVDGDGDGRRDLLGNWSDIFASVANYFVAHDWEPNAPIATQARPAEGGTAPVTDNKLEIKDTLASLQRQGIRVEPGLAGDLPAALFELEGESSPEYWIGFRNFYVITRYNRSVMYALAVYQLSQAIREEPAALARLSGAE